MTSALHTTAHIIEEFDDSSSVQYALCGKLLALEKNLPFVDHRLRGEVITSTTGNWLTLFDILSGGATASSNCLVCKRVVVKAVSQYRERVYAKRRKKEIAAEDRMREIQAANEGDWDEYS